MRKGLMIFMFLGLCGIAYAQNTTTFTDFKNSSTVKSESKKMGQRLEELKNQSGTQSSGKGVSQGSQSVTVSGRSTTADGSIPGTSSSMNVSSLYQESTVSETQQNVQAEHVAKALDEKGTSAISAEAFRTREAAKKETLDVLARLQQLSAPQDTLIITREFTEYDLKMALLYEKFEKDHSSLSREELTELIAYLQSL